MLTIHADHKPPTFKQLKEVVEVVKQGGVIIYPTDTIYGLGCDAMNQDAVKQISAIKQRDPGKPFSFICEDVAQISEFAFVPNWAFKLIKRCLPGPYTFILEARRTNLPKKILGKRNTVGVRIPDHPVCASLVKMLKHPILTTSVNLSGGEPLTDPEMLGDEFKGKIDMIISVGPVISDPSTIIDCTGSAPELIREGKGEIPW